MSDFDKRFLIRVARMLARRMFPGGKSAASAPAPPGRDIVFPISFRPEKKMGKKKQQQDGMLESVLAAQESGFGVREVRCSYEFLRKLKDSLLPDERFTVVNEDRTDTGSMPILLITPRGKRLLFRAGAEEEKP